MSRVGTFARKTRRGSARPARTTSTSATKLRAGTAEIMRSDTGSSHCLSVGFDKLPDDLFAQHFACDSVSAIYWTEDKTFRHIGWKCPRIDGHLNPGRHRSGADATVFADQVNGSTMHQRPSRLGFGGFYTPPYHACGYKPTNRTPDLQVCSSGPPNCRGPLL